MTLLQCHLDQAVKGLTCSLVAGRCQQQQQMLHDHIWRGSRRHCRVSSETVTVRLQTPQSRRRACRCALPAALKSRGSSTTNYIVPGIDSVC